jgi:uncharacterized protein YqjF (DUF2071 family)
MAAPGLSASPPVLAREMVIAQWAQLTFINWSYDPAVLRPSVPSELELETYDGKAWLSLVGFMVRKEHFPKWPPLPVINTYPQFNIRTYVRGPDGAPGVWFWSMDVSQPIMLSGRLIYHAPFMWASMNVSQEGSTVRYQSRRIWPGPPASSRFAVEIGAPLPPGADDSGLSAFLTLRWWMFLRTRKNWVRAAVTHEPWPLQSARLVDLEQNLTDAAGLPRPAGQPLAMYSENVTAHVGDVVQL